jgi:flagellar biosynthetic protein FliP
VLALTRQALGTAQTPPNQVILGLSLFLTFAIMSPVFTKIYEDAFLPYSEDQIGHMEAVEKTYAPLRDFMLPLTRESDLALFMDITNSETPDEPSQLSAAVVIPAFIVSELNTAFQIAFLIYIPFLILDMVISSVLTSMSMITLPPTVISLPLKLMLFVIIDGWSLIIGNLVKTYGAV